MKRLLLMMFGIGLILAGCGEGGGSNGGVTTVGDFDSTIEPETISPAALVQAAVQNAEAATSYRADAEIRFSGIPFYGEIT
ncbi:MAG: hypothetical protein OXF99_08270 [bacterium]|nr:hypothetical protein [bacterium]